MNTRWTCTVLLLALGEASCAAKIEEFSAAPHYIARGKETTVSWKASGAAVLSAEPPLAGTGPVAAEGSRTFSPEQKTVFTLRCGDKAFARQEVDVFADGQEKPLVFRTEPDQHGGLVAAETLPDKDWGDLRVALVTNTSDRKLQVVHAERSVLVLPAATTEELRDTPAAGRWELHAELQAGEVIGDPQHAPPDRLRVKLTITPAK